MMNRDMDNQKLSGMQALFTLAKAVAGEQPAIDHNTAVLFLALAVKSSPHLKGSALLVSFLVR
jgi:hypothetical protein